MIDLGSDLNQQKSDGMTALHIAMWVENTEIFSLLIDNGADPNIEDGEGDAVIQTPEGKKLMNIIQEMVNETENLNNCSRQLLN